MTRPFLAKSRTADIALFARHAEDAIKHLERLACAAGLVAFSPHFTSPYPKLSSPIFDCTTNLNSNSNPHPSTSPLLSPACALDVQDLSQRYTLDVALDSFFGIGDVGTMRDPLARPEGWGAEEEKDVACGDEKEDEGTENEDAHEDADIATNRSAIKAFAHAMEHAADVTILRARQGVLWPLIEFRCVPPTSASYPSSFLSSTPPLPIHL